MVSAVSQSRPIRTIRSSRGESSLAMAVPKEPEPRTAAEVNFVSDIAGFGFAGEAVLGACEKPLNIGAVFPNGEDGDDD